MLRNVHTTPGWSVVIPTSRSLAPPWPGAIGQSVTGLRTTSSPNRPMQVWQRRSSGVSLHRRRSDPCDRNSPHQVSDCSALMMCHNEASTRIRIRTASGSISTYGAVTSQVTARQSERPNSHGRLQIFEGPTCCPSASLSRSRFSQPGFWRRFVNSRLPDARCRPYRNKPGDPDTHS